MATDTMNNQDVLAAALADPELKKRLLGAITAAPPTAPPTSNPLMSLLKTIAVVGTGGLAAPAIAAPRTAYNRQLADYNRQRDTAINTLDTLGQLDNRELLRRKITGELGDTERERARVKQLQPLQDLQTEQSVEEATRYDPLRGASALQKSGLSFGRIGVDDDGETVWKNLLPLKPQTAEVPAGGTRIDLRTGKPIFTSPYAPHAGARPTAEETARERYRRMAGGFLGIDPKEVDELDVDKVEEGFKLNSGLLGGAKGQEQILQESLGRPRGSGRKKGGLGAPPPGEAQLRSDAEAAMAAGAPREAVAAKFKELTGKDL